MVFDYDICLILEFLLYISSCFRVFVDSDRFWTTLEILELFEIVELRRCIRSLAMEGGLPTRGFPII